MGPSKRSFGWQGAAPRWWMVLAILLGFSMYGYFGRGGPERVGESSRFGGYTMGTTYSVVLGEPQSASAREALKSKVDALLADINASMSTFDPSSELSRFNAHASTEPFEVSEPLADVVGMALDVSRASAGAFDVTVGPLVDAWGFGPHGRPDRAPEAPELAALRERVGYAKLMLDGNQLRKAHPQLQVDLSAIAKGYAVDRVAALLERLGHRDYLVEIGGELRALGRNAHGRPFRVGIETPVPDARRVYTAVALEEGGMATSGNYRNRYELEGGLYVHTLDPSTGRPVHHRLLSATVLHPTCAMADAWATALIAAGPKRAWELAERAGLEVLLLEAGDDGSLVERASPGFARRRLQDKTNQAPP